MRAAALWSLALTALSASASLFTPTPTTKTKRWDHGFVTIENGRFIRNGEPFSFLGTNAYWLPSLNTEADINRTVANISAHGIKVIRTWAFNDVDEIPVNGTWFQLVQNGTTFVNTGSNGLQKLDQVVKAAEVNGVLLILSLTNNWNPRPLIDNTTVVPVDGSLGRRDVTVGTNNSFPRNFLSNDFGGMDAYVREFGATRQHDEFYLNETIVNIFKNYTTQVVNRYKDSPAILAWELANDPRCSSSILASNVCNTTTVTGWHQDVGQHVASIDPNHLVSSGASGFQCANCPKLFPLAPAPSVSATPQRRKRNFKPFSNDRILADVKESRKKTREVKKRQLLDSGDGIRIRGRWIATRQSVPSVGTTVGPAFDGSSGVDSQDILNAPSIGFGSFQLFPDQNNYSVAGPDPNLPAFNQTVQDGLQFITLQGQIAQQVGKPTVMTAFGLVTQDNLPFFVPFNSTNAPFNNTNPLNATTTVKKRQANPAAATAGVSNAQLVDAYSQWINAAAQAQLGGAMQYQWGQDGLSSNDGSTVDQNADESTTTPNDNTSGITPNDGYQSAPTGDDGVQSVLTDLTSLFG
ncbi:glycoside hydrolase family 5 protein [Fomitiporia mediterranea MF3/22]|uniref:glycoside hydrolase family 5 protein n=1 Tax=Fomitiporia mediterranea (strain MF3/22) TaxID=694068 RepID=UPI0004409A47|nr:glycoside hydrolase family 5 protein [Fomitiporia mediterranea MF3/22]EJD06057.1 glycoside hydrolase family 5 protein [Fomitiporia mediterranea MF3/22]